MKSEMRSLLSIGLDWLIVLTAIYISKIHFAFLILAIVIIGSRQRALSNLVHDASHVNLFQFKSINDIVSNLFCAFPMLETVSGYRTSHSLHHKFLGNPKNDPDSLAHLSYGYDDLNPWKGNPILNYFKLIFNVNSWKISFFGNIKHVSRFDKFLIFIFNLFIFFTICVIGSQEISIYAFKIWYISRATAYHLIRVAAEFLDHSGLENSSVINYCRNLPHDGLLRFVLHPNQDTYHIIHHLHPRIPHYNLKAAHALLLKDSAYTGAHHCNGYFFGSHSAINCWTGKCKESL